MTARTWRMFAGRHQGRLVSFGEARHVRFCDLEPVPVELVEDPDGPYWGWLDAHREPKEPIMVQPHEAAFRTQFPYGFQAEVERGKGEVVRLAVREVEVGQVPTW